MFVQVNAHTEAPPLMHVRSALLLHLVFHSRLVWFLPQEFINKRLCFPSPVLSLCEATCPPVPLLLPLSPSLVSGFSVSQDRRNCGAQRRRPRSASHTPLGCPFTSQGLHHAAFPTDATRQASGDYMKEEQASSES